MQIGIHYMDLPEGAGRLSGCYNDVKTLHNLIVNKYNFKSDHCRMLMDDGNHIKPTRKNIEKAIAWLVADAKSGDT